MTDRIEFDLPIWSIEIEHRNPGSDGLWLRAVNSETEQEAVRKALALFVGEGLNRMLIDRIVVCELKGGEDDGNQVQ